MGELRIGLVGGLWCLVAILGCGSSASNPSTGGGGPGGATSSSTAVGTGGQIATTSSSATGGGGTGGAGGGTPADHVLISEIGVQPEGGEFVEIYNPTSAAVDLTDYYLSDNSGYTSIAQGVAWNPVTSNPGTDFLVQFPSGTTLPAGGVIVVAGSLGGAPSFDTQFGVCPDFVFAATDTPCSIGGTAKAMVAPTNGGFATATGAILSNDREMVVLFTWDGDTTHRVFDVDYVTWGTLFDDATRIDKTGLTGYKSETPRATQVGATAPGVFQSIERCALETGEKTSGGNGITGHDETSEPFDQNFTLQTTPSPGVKNTCLP